jgi:hypothetical protein
MGAHLHDWTWAEPLGLPGQTVTFCRSCGQRRDKHPAGGPDGRPRATASRLFEDDDVMDWGVVIDALVEHAASSRARKAVNSASTSDERAEICERMVKAARAEMDRRGASISPPAGEAGHIVRDPSHMPEVGP